MNRIIPLAFLLACNGAFAAEILSETTENGAKIRWSVLNIGPQGVIRIDEGDWAASVSAPAAGSMNSASVQFTKGEVRDSIIYNPNEGEILMLEGKVCRVLSADSPPPPGMEFMSSPEMDAHREQMGSAVNDAIRQMEASGASQQQIDAMKEMMGGMNIPGMQKPQRPSYSFELVDGNASVAGYGGRRYSISDQNGAERYRVVMVSVDDLPGGRQARDGMEGMMGVFRDYMQGAGVPMGYGDALMEVMQDSEFATDYPAEIEDVQQNSVTSLVSASEETRGVDFAPQCERKGMMEP